MRRIGRITPVLMLLFATVITSQAGEPRNSEARTDATKPATAEEAIRKELDDGVQAWNRGDLKGFLHGYWHSQELTFFAGSEESAGWDQAYQRYRTAYLGKDKQMGKLNFSNLRVEILSPEAAFVRGQWQLTMKDGSKRQGLFTLVMKQFPDGWRIIHDHSS